MDDEKKFTQADLDRIIGERLTQDRATRGDPTVLLQTVSDLRQQNTTLQQERDALQSKVATVDRTGLLTKVGMELKVPPTVLEFVQGATEDEMKASATKLLAGIGPGPSLGGATNPPGGNTAPKVYTSAELKGMKPEAINADWVNISAQLKSGQVK